MDLLSDTRLAYACVFVALLIGMWMCFHRNLWWRTFYVGVAITVFALARIATQSAVLGHPWVYVPEQMATFVMVLSVAFAMGVAVATAWHLMRNPK